MILSDLDLVNLCGQGLISPYDDRLINPASIDIRIGRTIMVEEGVNGWQPYNLDDMKEITLTPGQFALVSTYESFRVPNGYAMDLRLKSSSARAGWDHALAFWVDPGWNGILTMEIRNSLKYNDLKLSYMQRFAQVIVHQLSRPALNPYVGRYQHAAEVERHKP